MDCEQFNVEVISDHPYAESKSGTELCNPIRDCSSASGRVGHLRHCACVGIPVAEDLDGKVFCCQIKLFMSLNN